METYFDALCVQGSGQVFEKLHAQTGTLGRIGCIREASQLGGTQMAGTLGVGGGVQLDLVHAGHRAQGDDVQVGIDEQAHQDAGLGQRLRGRAADRVFQALKQWRNSKIESAEQYTSYTVASNAVLKCIAEVRPFDKEELENVPNLRNWQLVEFGQEILDVLDEVSPRKQ